MSSNFKALCLLSALLACGGPEVDPDEEATADDEAAIKIAPWSREACAVVALANQGSLAVLDDEAKLDRRAARSIFDARTSGTPDDPADDRVFASFAEVDELAHVGTAALRKLLRYAEDHGFACTFPRLELQLINVSDWHGQLDPIAVPMVGNVAGAAALATYFAQERAANPNTLVLTAGDGFGATPPLASFFEELPAVLAMNEMGFDVDGIGNHNFDRGVEHFERMAQAARFPYLSANLSNAGDNVSCPEKENGACIEPYRIFDVGGVKVAVIGVTNPDAIALTKPGSFGSIQVGHPVVGALRAKFAAEREGAEVFVVIAHLGAIGTVNGQPIGPLVDFANAVEGFHAILGDHTNLQVNLQINGAAVVENRSNGVTYARTTLLFDRDTRTVTGNNVTFVTPLSDAVTADPEVVAVLAPYRAQLSQIFDSKIAEATDIFARGMNVERLREMPIGNLVAEAMRAKYGTQLGFTNGGGLRAPIPSSYAPVDTSLRRPAAGYRAGPPYDVVVGDAYAVLPFGNSVVTRTVTGAQVWRMMEHSVEALPNANGWFGQISGFRMVFDSTKPAGSRVTSLTLADGRAILADETRYTMATSDFIDAGGDGYTMLINGDGTSRDKMADVLLEHIRTLGVLEPITDGRILDEVRP